MLPEELHRIALSLKTYGDYLNLPNSLRDLLVIERRRQDVTRLNLAPRTLTGDAWIAAMDRQTEQALEAIYQ